MSARSFEVLIKERQTDVGNHFLLNLRVCQSLGDQLIVHDAIFRLGHKLSWRAHSTWRNKKVKNEERVQFWGFSLEYLGGKVWENFKCYPVVWETATTLVLLVGILAHFGSALFYLRVATFTYLLLIMFTPLSWSDNSFIWSRTLSQVNSSVRYFKWQAHGRNRRCVWRRVSSNARTMNLWCMDFLKKSRFRPPLIYFCLSTLRKSINWRKHRWC